MLALNFNSIYESNLIPFCEALGITEDDYQDYKKAKEAEEARYVKQRAEWIKEAKARETLIKQATEEFEKNHSYEKIEKHELIEGLVCLTIKTDWNDKIIYKIKYFYKPTSRSSKFRKNEKDFNTVEEALSYVPDQGYCDYVYVYSGTATGYLKSIVTVLTPVS